MYHQQKKCKIEQKSKCIHMMEAIVLLKKMSINHKFVDIVSNKQIVKMHVKPNKMNSFMDFQSFSVNFIECSVIGERLTCVKSAFFLSFFDLIYVCYCVDQSHQLIRHNHKRADVSKEIEEKEWETQKICVTSY